MDMDFNLTVPRNFAGLLMSWATEASITHTWDMPVNGRAKVPAWVTLSFHSKTARDKVLMLARGKIANLHIRCPLAADRLQKMYDITIRSES